MRNSDCDLRMRVKKKSRTGGKKHIYLDENERVRHRIDEVKIENGDRHDTPTPPRSDLRPKKIERNKNP
jgi:hypothetical protein